MLYVDHQGQRLEFEHSLLSLSKWESIHEKPFFAWNKDDTKTPEEMLSYFEEMLVTPGVHKEVVREFSEETYLDFVEYINAKRTATVVRETDQKPGPRENVTSELIYYWMVSFKIPFHPAETWHLNRLMTLIRVAGVKNNTKPKKMSASATAAKYRELNEQRKRQMGTSG